MSTAKDSKHQYNKTVASSGVRDDESILEDDEFRSRQCTLMTHKKTPNIFKTGGALAFDEQQAFMFEQAMEASFK